MVEQPYQANCGSCGHANVTHHEKVGRCVNGRKWTYGPNGGTTDMSNQCDCQEYDCENETDVWTMCALLGCRDPFPDRACEKCGLVYHASYESDCLFRHECSVAYQEDQAKLKAWTEAATS